MRGALQLYRLFTSGTCRVDLTSWRPRVKSREHGVPSLRDGARCAEVFPIASGSVEMIINEGKASVETGTEEMYLASTDERVLVLTAPRMRGRAAFDSPPCHIRFAARPDSHSTTA